MRRSQLSEPNPNLSFLLGFLWVGTLAWIGSPTVPSAFAAPSATEIRDRDPVPFHFQSDLQDLLRRSLQSHSRPSIQDIESFSDGFLRWKSKIETILPDPYSPFSSNAKVGLTFDYFQELGRWVSIRAGAGLRNDPSLLKKFRIQVPQPLKAQLIASGEFSTTGYELGTLPFAFEKDFLTLTRSFVLDCERGAASAGASSSENPEESQRALLKLIQLLVVQQLKQNHEELHALVSPANASPFLKPLDFPGSSNALGSETPQRESAFRESLLHFAPLELADHARWRKQSNRLGPRGLRATLANEFESRGFALHRLTEPILRGYLRKALTTAMASTAIAELLSRLEEGELALDQGERKRLAEEIERERVELEAKLPEAPFTAWILAVREDTRSGTAKDRTSRVFRERRARLISEILEQTKRIQEVDQETSSSTPADLSLLAPIFEKKLASLRPSAAVTEVFEKIAAARDHAAAEKLFSELVKTWRARSRSHLTPIFSENVNPRLVASIQLRIFGARAKNLKDLYTVGSWFQLDETRKSAPPLASYFTEEEGFEKYRELYRHRLLAQNSLLSAEVSVPLGSLRWITHSLPLHQALSESPSPLEEADSFVDQALLFSEAKIRESLKKVTQAKSWEDLEAVATSAFAQAAVLSSYSELSLFHAQLVEQISTPDTLSKVLHRYIHPGIGWGLGSLQLLHFSRMLTSIPASSAWSLLHLLAKGTSPFIRSYLLWTAPLLALDMVNEAQNAWEAQERAELTEILYHASSGGKQAIATLDEFSKARSYYEAARSHLIRRTAMDAALTYNPLLRSLLRSRAP